MKKYLSIIAIVLVLTGCSQGPTDSRLKVVTSFYPLSDFAKRVGGEHVNVYNILPSGADAHSFEPSPKDIQKIAESDLFIIHGLGFETWTNSVLESSIVKNVPVLTSGMYTDVIERENFHTHEHEDDHITSNHEGHDHRPLF